MSDDPMNDLLERATIAQERASAEYAEGLRRYAADRGEGIGVNADPEGLAKDIDRIIRRRMAEAYCLGWRAAIESQGIGYANPYRGRREK